MRIVYASVRNNELKIKLLLAKIGNYIQTLFELKRSLHCNSTALFPFRLRAYTHITTTANAANIINSEVSNGYNEERAPATTQLKYEWCIRQM